MALFGDYRYVHHKFVLFCIWPECVRYSSVSVPVDFGWFCPVMFVRSISSPFSPVYVLNVFVIPPYQFLWILGDFVQ